MTRTLPWSQAEARSAFLCLALGTVLLAAAWWGSSGDGQHDATGWLSAGIGGAVLVALGDLLWFTAGRRAVLDRRTALSTRLSRAVEPRTPAGQDGSAWVALAGSRRFHRGDCVLVLGKVVVTAGPGLEPCEMCRP